MKLINILKFLNVMLIGVEYNNRLDNHFREFE